MYYMEDDEDKPRSTLNIKGALISQICSLNERDNCILIEIMPPNGKNYYFSFNSLEEAKKWQRILERVSQVTLPRKSIESNIESFLSPSKDLDSPIKKDEMIESIVLSPIKPRPDISPKREENVFQTFDIPVDFESLIKEISSYILEEQADWGTLKYKQGMKISTLGESQYFPIVKRKVLIGNKNKQINKMNNRISYKSFSSNNNNVYIKIDIWIFNVYINNYY